MLSSTSSVFASDATTAAIPTPTTLPASRATVLLTVSW